MGVAHIPELGMSLLIQTPRIIRETELQGQQGFRQSWSPEMNFRFASFSVSRWSVRILKLSDDLN